MSPAHLDDRVRLRMLRTYRRGAVIGLGASVIMLIMTASGHTAVAEDDRAWVTVVAAVLALVCFGLVRHLDTRVRLARVKVNLLDSTHTVG